MKSMMLTGIREMKLIQVPDPVIVNHTDVLIKMKVTGVCGSDIHYYKTGKIGSQVVEYPFTVGHEGAGEVVETGTAVTRVQPGDRIAIEPAMPCGSCDQCSSGRPHTCRNLRFLGCPGQAAGCLSEYMVLPESSCFPIPHHMSYDEAVLSEPLAIGLYAVNNSIPMKDARIGILGTGPIGMSVLLSAKAKGASKIYVTDKIRERRNLAVTNGAFDAGNPDQHDIVKEIINREPTMLDSRKRPTRPLSSSSRAESLSSSEYQNSTGGHSVLTRQEEKRSPFRISAGKMKPLPKHYRQSQAD